MISGAAFLSNAWRELAASERVFKFPKRGSQGHFDRTLAEKNLEELASLAGLAWPCAIGKSNLKTPSQGRLPKVMTTMQVSRNFAASREFLKYP